MTEKNSVEELTAQLKEKILAEIEAGHSYEALNYAQSFVARKRKHLGKNATSALVFFGTRLLVDNGAASDAGTLLAWYIEDGAGDDFLFHLEDRALVDKDLYCDVQRISDLLVGLTLAQTSPIVSKIHGPVHKAILNKKKIKKNGPLSKRLEIFEKKCADTFEETKDWLSAYKAVLRLEASDMARAAKILDLWSNEGYATEKHLFFARAVLQLLSDGKIAKASEFLLVSAKYVEIPENSKCVNTAAVAVWNLATILTNLAALPPKQRVEPTKIFTIIAQLYFPLLSKIDHKLIDLLEKVCFHSSESTHIFYTSLFPPNTDRTIPLLLLLIPYHLLLPLLLLLLIIFFY